MYYFRGYVWDFLIPLTIFINQYFSLYYKSIPVIYKNTKNNKEIDNNDFINDKSDNVFNKKIDE